MLSYTTDDIAPQCEVHMAPYKFFLKNISENIDGLTQLITRLYIAQKTINKNLFDLLFLWRNINLAQMMTQLHIAIEPLFLDFILFL